MSDLVAIITGSAGLLGFAASAYGLAASRTKLDAERVEAVTTRMGHRGIWTGAWLVSVPSALAAEVRTEAETRCKAGSPPEDVLALWEQKGAAIEAHLPGPQGASDADAVSWVERTVERLAADPLPAHGEDLAAFALVYATREPPPASAEGVGALRPLVGASSVAAAFVACRTRPAGRLVRALGLARWAFLTVAVGGAAAGAIESFLDSGATPRPTTPSSASVAHATVHAPEVREPAHAAETREAPDAGASGPGQGAGLIPPRTETPPRRSVSVTVKQSDAGPN